MQDLGEEHGGAGPPLFLDQNEARRAEKNFFEACPHPLSQGLDDRASPYVRVWIRHWTVMGLKERERELMLLKLIEDIRRWREDMNFIFEWQNNILRTSAASE